MQCELCGRKTQLYVAEIEGSNLNVCSDCAKFGRIIRGIQEPSKKREKEGRTAKKAAAEEPEIIEVIVDGYGDLIKRKRERLGLTQKEFAKKIAERESLIQKIETENIEPSIPLARKLEKLLGIKLVEEVKDEKVQIQKGKGAIFTIGDFIKVRKRK